MKTTRKTTLKKKVYFFTKNDKALAVSLGKGITISDAEDKARRIALKKKLKLAGGYDEVSKPNWVKEIINVPSSTKPLQEKGFPLWAVENPEEYGMTEKDLKKAWQKLVDTGQAWSLQGWYGRTAMDLIKRGVIHPPKKKTQKNQYDYWGNKLYS